MEFKVLSRKDIEELNDFPQKTIIISIRNINGRFAKIKKDKNIVNTLYLAFDDVEDPKDGMNEQQAATIISFVNDHMNDAELCIVHCVGGISRSAGVCAALMKIVTGDDSKIFNNPNYCPNRNCYSTILRKYYGVYDLEEIEEKFKHNIEIWREANKELFQ